MKYMDGYKEKEDEILTEVHSTWSVFATDLKRWPNRMVQNDLSVFRLLLLSCCVCRSKASALN